MKSENQKCHPKDTKVSTSPWNKGLHHSGINTWTKQREATKYPTFASHTEENTKLFSYHRNVTDWTVFIPEQRVILFTPRNKFPTGNNYEILSSQHSVKCSLSDLHSYQTRLHFMLLSASHHNSHCFESSGIPSAGYPASCGHQELEMNTKFLLSSKGSKFEAKIL